MERSKYKPIGVDLSRRIPSSPSIQSIFNLKPINTELEESIEETDELLELITRQEHIYEQINFKLDELSKVNSTIEVLIKQRDIFNPLPTPDDDSSIASFGSDTSQLEVELNEKILQMDKGDLNILKLKNVLNNSIELINFTVNNKKLSNVNDDFYYKSNQIKNQLSRLVDSFTTNNDISIDSNRYI